MKTVNKKLFDELLEDFAKLNDKYKQLQAENERLKKQICTGANALSVAEETIANLGTATRENEQLRGKVFRAVDSEPDCPGDMPDEMWAAINGDRDATSEAIRSAVRLTKHDIRTRIDKALKIKK